MFGYTLNKKYLYIILALIVIRSLARYTSLEIVGLLISLPGVIIAISFHEFAHAFVADKLGDDTPRNQDRLTLNPLKHLDPVGTILLVFAGFGWGKPVQINPRNFNRDVTMDKGEILVSIAGPAMNFILAIVSAFILGALYAFTGLIYNDVGAIALELLQGFIIVNIGLGVFNLIPLPPLDGSKIFINLFPYNAKRWIRENSMVFYIIFLAIWITGLAGIIISPIITVLYNGLIDLVLKLFGLF